ncbi:MAG: HAMP domain-containing sensor histidine kinase [Nitriliruptorales bacterium]|nr:HAMP domain-containing sensor histidine kinase [Nitriliruptorales bacterium]
MRFLAAIVVGVTAALLISEAAMQPSGEERLALLALFGGVAVLAAGVAVALRRWSPRSLRTTVLAITFAAIGVAAVAVVGSATSMFISAHDLKLVLVALGLGLGLGSIVALTLTRDLLADLTAIGRAAKRVAAGDRSVTTGVERRDEIGALAATLDDAIVRLRHADEERREVDAARRRFLASIGHDLRTPLTSLRSAIEALQDGLVDDPDRYLAAMRTDVALLSSLVEDLFLLARIESGVLELDRQPIDLAELADGVIEAVRPAADAANVTVVLDAPGPVPVVGSPRELSRVLRNLLDNAVRHAPPGSEVRVQLEGEGGPSVTIRDDGPGFSEDFLEVAFESFTRADEARVRDGAGSGLGLAIAHGLVDAHGGEIRAFPGPGGKVTVTLPGPDQQ